MNAVGLNTLIMNDAARIVTAITTGAAWEIWMQVELAILFRGANMQAAREVPYPPPNGTWRLDCLAQDAFGSYAIEMKVESATNAGAAIITAVNQDRVKIANYPAQVPGARWVVGIGYSMAAINAMNGFALVPANNAIFNHANGIGVLISAV